MDIMDIKKKILIEKIVLGTIAAISIGVAIFCILWLVKSFNNATTPIVLSEPKPGRECATMVTGGGVAIDCWKTNE